MNKFKQYKKSWPHLICMYISLHVWRHHATKKQSFLSWFLFWIGHMSCFNGAHAQLLYSMITHINDSCTCSQLHFYMRVHDTYTLFVCKCVFFFEWIIILSPMTHYHQFIQELAFYSCTTCCKWSWDTSSHRRKSLTTYRINDRSVLANHPYFNHKWLAIHHQLWGFINVDLPLIWEFHGVSPNNGFYEPLNQWFNDRPITTNQWYGGFSMLFLWVLLVQREPCAPQEIWCTIVDTIQIQIDTTLFTMTS